MCTWQGRADDGEVASLRWECDHMCEALSLCASAYSVSVSEAFGLTFMCSICLQAGDIHGMYDTCMYVCVINAWIHTHITSISIALSVECTI